VGPVPPESQGGVKVVSINLLLEQEDQAVIWRDRSQRGNQAVLGDIFGHARLFDRRPAARHLRRVADVMQALPLSGVVLVTSPQDWPHGGPQGGADGGHDEDPILGLIENMSYFECPDTGKRHEIFGSSHAEEMAADGRPFLGRLPIDPQIARLADAGRIEEYAAEAFAPIAQALIGRSRGSPQG